MKLNILQVQSIDSLKCMFAKLAKHIMGNTCHWLYSCACEYVSKINIIKSNANVVFKNYVFILLYHLWFLIIS